MASRPLISRHSWPSPSTFATGTDSERIDDDPFAHFVSLSTDQVLSLEDKEFSADIAPSRSAMRRSHSLSPDPQRARRFLIQHGPASSPSFKLKRWIKRMEQQYRHHDIDVEPEVIEITPRNVQQADDLASAEQDGMCGSVDEEKVQSRPISPPLRGRKEFRIGSGRRTVRRRPRAWRAPSEDLWTVTEELEGDGMGLGILGADRSC